MTVNAPAASAFRPRLASYYAKWKSEFCNDAWTLLGKYSGKLG